MRYIISGVALSGNKGASGMAEALIQNLRRKNPEAEFDLFSYYPKADRNLALPPHTRILDGSPMAVVRLFFPALWAAVCRGLHLPSGWWRRGMLGEVARADYWLDASGISFVDGREKFLIFNILSIWPGWCAGVPVVKVAQAMGPFRHRINRWCARLVLPRLHLICARGARTREYLDELGLRNVENFSDVAFSLDCSAADRARVAAWGPGTGKMVGISPSQVVWKLCQGNGIDYPEILKQCVARLVADGYECVIFPHSARAGVEKTHNNDLPLLRHFAALLPESPRIRVIEAEWSAGELRELIGGMDFLIASRFHAIVSAMATGVPAVVIGWSHKYAEVLAPFEQEELVVGYEELSAAAILDRVERIQATRAALNRRILEAGGRIRRENERFFARISAPVPK